MSDVNVEDVCAICLTPSDKTESLCMAPKVGFNGASYREVIKEMVGVEMGQHHHLPCTICSPCARELESAFNFVSKCKASYTKLQEAAKSKLPLHKLLEETPKEDEELTLNMLSKPKEEITGTVVKHEMLDVTYIKQEDNTDKFFHDYEDDDDDDIKSEIESVRHKNNKIIGTKKNIKLSKANPLECKNCKQTFDNSEMIKKHMEIHKKDKSFVCSHCNKAFSLKCTLKEHIGRIHMKSLHLAKSSCVCDLCGKICYRKYDLTLHMRTHTKEKPYKCTLCGDSFGHGNLLTHHMRRHRGERPCSCKVCGRGFVSPSGLKSHMLVHSDEKKFKCQICGKGFKSNMTLKQHILLHASHKPNVCEVCGTAFAQKVNLKHHIIAKHSERSGTCEICKKTFSNLSDHMRIHTGEKPFTCNICGKGFPRQREHTIHLRRHREATKFACTHDKCDAAFSMQCQLEFHVLKYHTKHFPFICDICSKGFYRLADLKRHENSSNCKKVKEGPENLTSTVKLLLTDTSK